MNPNLKIEKSVVQVKFKPELSFFDKLYKNDKIFSPFPHWLTDRLKLTLRDYEKKHSLTINHESITYETDKYIIKNEEEIIKLISNNLNNITTESKITYLGHRYFCLVPLQIKFEELVKILNLKIFSKDFFSSLNQKPDDSTITITSYYKELKYRMQVGPMKNTEVPNFIRFNIENHIDASSNTKFLEVANVLNTYPKTSLFIDLDLFKLTLDPKSDIIKFHCLTNESFSDITKNLLSYIFEVKLK